jgi:hypothetical protein
MSKRKRGGGPSGHSARVSPYVLLTDSASVDANLSGTGFCLKRGCVNESDADSIHTTLIDDADLRWTALRDGGNPDSMLGDTQKAYCGTLSSLMLRGGRWRRQLFNDRSAGVGPPRRFNALLEQCEALVKARSTVGRMVRADAARNGLQTQAGEAVCAAEPSSSSQQPQNQLLTEQLIRYTRTDCWFAPHWDKGKNQPFLLLLCLPSKTNS